MSYSSSKLLFIALLLLQACKTPTTANNDLNSIPELLQCKLPLQNLASPVSKIAFGSAMSQNSSLKVLELANSYQPDLFLFLGDNIDGETKDMKLLAAKYSKLCARPEFQNLYQNCPVLATWNDHDYGLNDSGREYPRKAESRALFLSFWNPPKTATLPTKGIYQSYVLSTEGKQLQLILLDTRSFRSPLLSTKKSKDKNRYLPNKKSTATILGADQWAWLQQQLSKPADLRLICSSIPFGAAHNGYETWANFPEEQKRMTTLIREEKANAVFFLSGNAQYGELSKMPVDEGYPIYDCTASGINKNWPYIAPNEHRIAEACRNFHFGYLRIDWLSQELNIQLITASKKIALDQQIKFANLQIK